MILAGIGDPLEGLGVGVVVVEEAVDGGLKVCDGSEDATLEAPLGQDGEEALDGVEPGSRSRREVKGPAGMAREPSPHGGMLVGGIVVEDRMDRLAGGNFALDGVEEADELLMPVALHVAADHGSVCQWRRDFPQNGRRKIPQSGGLAINRGRDRLLRFLAAGRAASGSVEWD